MRIQGESNCSALEKALNHAKKLRIDECEIVFLKKEITTVRITDSEIFEIKQNFDKSYGIRLIHNNKIVSAQTSDENELQKMIDVGLKRISNLKSIEFWKGLPQNTHNRKLEGTFDQKLQEISGKEAIDLAQNMIDSTDHKKIDTITGSLNIVSEEFTIRNNIGMNQEEKSTYISGIINAESETGIIPVSGIGNACCRTKKNFSPEQIGKDARNMCIESINPTKTESGKYSVIFEPYSVGELLAFVIAANFDSRLISEKKSCFSNNFREQIGIEDLNIIDDPHVAEGIGTKSFDDEGIQTKKNVFVENGVFKNTFSNLLNAYKEDKENSTGNAVRVGSPTGRSSNPIPSSLPHNLKILPGNTSQEEMIKDTKQGLLVGRLWYTYAVNPIKGDFSCTARSGIRIIENGEIKKPGKSVRIVHNLPVMLRNISAIGSNLRNVIQWASLPSITPSIRVENIKVDSI